MLYLSHAIGRPVLDATGEPLGKVDDLIVAVGNRYPPVTGLVVATDRRRIFLPWSQVARFDASGALLSGDTIDITRFQQRSDEILLRADLLDKQIVDIDGRRVVRVNDLRLDDVEGKLHLVAVDVGWTRQEKILPAVAKLLPAASGSSVLTLIKPHYESDLARTQRGVLTAAQSEEVLWQVIDQIAAMRTGDNPAWRVKGVVQSPVEGQKGNVEFIAWLERLA